MLLDRFFRWREQRQLRNARIPVALWQRVVDDALSHFHLNEHELHQLRELASLFLLRKTISGAGGIEVDDYMRAVIASQACLLILNLDLDYFNGWVEVIVYPDAFIVNREERDENGIIHNKRSVLGGEAWGRGPLILSWKDARPDAHIHGNMNDRGSNVILHEFAHKLDMLDGSADGTPPLHPDMELRTWIDTFTETYNRLREQIRNFHRTDINPYAAENPAEFFAVISEEFFEAPEKLHHNHADVYQQLRLFYRQDPLSRSE